MDYHHTPDTWEVEEESGGRAYVLRAQRDTKRMVLGLGAGLGYDEFKANAYLMAAAPELFRALGDLYEAASLYFAHENVDVPTRRRTLAQAIQALDRGAAISNAISEDQPTSGG